LSSEIIKVPDIGGDTDVEIIEIAVSEGDVIEAEDTLITLESDKASMDVPAPKGGKVLKVLVKEGDSVSEGDDIVELDVDGGESSSESDDEKQETSSDRQPEKAPAKQDTAKEEGTPNPEAQMADHKPCDGKLVHAGPAVRMLAREFRRSRTSISASLVTWKRSQWGRCSTLHGLPGRRTNRYSSLTAVMSSDWVS